MIVEREHKGNIYSKPIITQEHIEFIKQKYLEGNSQVEIGKMMGLSDRTIIDLMKKNNIKPRNNREQALKYMCNESFFEVVDTEKKAYWLGFMYADGFIQNKRKHSGYRVGITLSVVDREHLYKFRECVEGTQIIKTYKQTSGYGGDYSRILIASDKMAEDLISKGCILNKTDSLTFPYETILDKELIKHFIRGYIDGDGSLNFTYCKNTKDGKRDKFESKISVTGTMEMINGILKVFGVDHLKLDKRRKDRENNNYQINIGGNKQVIKILNWLYEDSTIHLNRKYEKYLEIKNIYENYLVELASNS